MEYAPSKHRRQSIRLPGYGYSQAGAYFVTICTRNRQCLFGEILNEEMVPSKYGQIVLDGWYDLASHYPHVALDSFVVMPNHIHGIIVLNDNVGAGLKPAPTKRHPLSEIARGFKTFSSRRINQINSTPGLPVWQRNYYEHVIRNEDEMDRIRQYILGNPMKWLEDEENPQNIQKVRS